jgi:hypothetical protein
MRKIFFKTGKKHIFANEKSNKETDVMTFIFLTKGKQNI